MIGGGRSGRSLLPDERGGVEVSEALETSTCEAERVFLSRGGGGRECLGTDGRFPALLSVTVTGGVFTGGFIARSSELLLSDELETSAAICWPGGVLSGRAAGEGLDSGGLWSFFRRGLGAGTGGLRDLEGFCSTVVSLVSKTSKTDGFRASWDLDF